MLLIDPLCKRQILVWLILVCCQDWCFMEQGKSLGGAEAGLAGGTADKLRDASALLTEHGMLPSWKEGGMNWLRSSDISPSLRFLFLCWISRDPVSTAWHWGSQLEWTSLRLVGAGDTGWAEVVEAGREYEGEAGRMGCENCRTIGAARGHH